MKLAAGVLALLLAVGLGLADELWLGGIAAVAGLWVTREHSALYRSDEGGAWAEGFDLGDLGDLGAVGTAARGAWGAGRSLLSGLFDR